MTVSVKYYEQKLLAANPRLFVVKGISKLYGVPSLRLGVLMFGDAGLVAEIKRTWR